MDKSTQIESGKEYKATMITAKEATEQAMQVMDRVTGEFYNPQEAFDAMMNKPEIIASFKRLAVR
jgi:uncharacterized iron-regulated membrane protein